jgi:hypothetical protein
MPRCRRSSREMVPWLSPARRPSSACDQPKNSRSRRTARPIFAKAVGRSGTTVISLCPPREPCQLLHNPYGRSPLRRPDDGAGAGNHDVGRQVGSVRPPHQSTRCLPPGHRCFDGGLSADFLRSTSRRQAWPICSNWHGKPRHAIDCLWAARPRWHERGCDAGRRCGQGACGQAVASAMDFAERHVKRCESRTRARADGEGFRGLTPSRGGTYSPATGRDRTERAAGGPPVWRRPPLG